MLVCLLSELPAGSLFSDQPNWVPVTRASSAATRVRASANVCAHSVWQSYASRDDVWRCCSGRRWSGIKRYVQLKLVRLFRCHQRKASEKRWTCVNCCFVILLLFWVFCFSQLYLRPRGRELLWGTCVTVIDKNADQWGVAFVVEAGLKNDWRRAEPIGWRTVVGGGLKAMSTRRAPTRATR